MRLRRTSDPNEIFLGMKMPETTRNLVLTTTNATINTDTGGLVMGRGHAKQVRDRYRAVDKKLAHAIRKSVIERVATVGEGDISIRLGERYVLYGDYYLIVSSHWPRVKLGAFQVKRSFSERADLDLISKSTMKLLEFIKANDVQRVDLPFPGIGNGKLSEAQVAPILEILPDNVRVWILE